MGCGAEREAIQGGSLSARCRVIHLHTACYFIFPGSWQTITCADGVPSNMTYAPDGFGAAGSMVALASNGHMIIQCGGSFTILAPGSSFMTTRPSFSQWDPPRAMYAMPGTVFDGLGALLIRSPHHCFTAASMHIGSGSGRFITVGMQVKPLVPGLPSLSVPSAPNTSTAASFAI